MVSCTLVVIECSISQRFFVLFWTFYRLAFIYLSCRLVPANPPAGYEEATGVPGDWNYMFPQALGNIGTCTAQGFFLYMGVCASVLFTGSIAVSFLLQIKFQFSDRQMRVSERYFFGINTAIPLLAAVLILIDRGFNPIAKGFCYVFTSPMICLKMFKGPAVGTSQEVTIQNYCDDEAEIRGKHSELYSVVLFFGPVLVVLLIIVVSMGMLFWTVRTQELRTAQWSAARAGRHQKRVFVQGMLYVSAYLAVWIPYIVGLALYDSNPVAVHYVGSFVLPLQGVLNMLIYSNMFSLFKEDAANVSRSIRNSVRSPSSSMTFGRSQKSFTPFGGSTRPGNCESTEEFQRSVSGKEIRNLGHTSGLPNKNEIIPTS